MTVRVYFNLRTQLWSIRAGGRVIDHQPCYALADCVFVVSEAGRLAVLRRRQRSVHAWVVGTPAPALTKPPPFAVEVTYNPYRSGDFTLRTGEPVRSSKVTWFIDRKAYVPGDSP